MIEYRVCNGICVLRLDAPPLNAITLEMLDALEAAIDRAAADGSVAGIVITSGASRFSAGADIHLFESLRSPADAVRLAHRFQQAFQRVEDSPKPVVAAMAGEVMGGALELAMACHWRLATPFARFSTPEVRLGFNPGAGGTQRLPRLVGPRTALEMLIVGRAIGAEEALRLGLVDGLCGMDDWIGPARTWIEGSSVIPRTSQRRDRIQDFAENAAALAEAARLAKGRPHLAAPSKIIEAVRIGLEQSFEAGLERERLAFGECFETPAAQNLIHLFFATRNMAKAPELVGAEARAVRRAAVVGMGSMGTGIAQALATAGLETAVCDREASILERGIARIRASLQRRVEQGRMSADKLEAVVASLRPTTELRTLAGAEVVIESVFENVAAKRAVLNELEGVCPAETLLATNTSTISLDVLAETMRRPERLVGMHFFNPAHHMPLVEIIRRRATPPEVVATAMELAKRLKKSPVLVNNREGFLVNRIFIPYLKEAFWLLEDGAEPQAVDAAMVAFGFSMGPLALCDMAGLDVLVDTDRVLSAAFPRHGRVSPVAQRLVEQGQLGQKTGAGVYRYEKGDHTPRDNPAAQEIISRLQNKGAGGPHDLSADAIAERLVLRMVAEAFCVLEEGVAIRPGDVDAAMVLGTGFPDFRGGPLRYAEGLGLDTLGHRLDNLANTLGERFEPCSWLREVVNKRK